MFLEIAEITKKNKERLNWDEYFMSIALLGHVDHHVQDYM